MSQTDFRSEQAVVTAYAPEVLEHRTPDYPVHPLILNRWSPRSYDAAPVSDEDLYTVLEAARWAPSSNNQQPWRFYIARTEEERARFLRFIMPGNQVWMRKAPVLIVLASSTKKENGDPNHAHAFDAGAAWGILSLQARLLGLSTRAAGGFDKEKAREVLQVPDDLALHIVLALGYKGDPGALGEDAREREKPNQRRPLRNSMIALPESE